MTYFQIILIVSLSLIIVIVLSRYLSNGTFYFTSFYSEKKEFIISEQLFKKNILIALQKSNFKKIKENNNSFSAIALPTMWSFSELINIDFEKIDETKFSIKFHSKCFFPLQIVDYGKNKRNSNRFFKNLDLVIHN